MLLCTARLTKYQVAATKYSIKIVACSSFQLKPSLLIVFHYPSEVRFSEITVDCVISSKVGISVFQSDMIPCSELYTVTFSATSEGITTVARNRLTVQCHAALQFPSHLIVISHVEYSCVQL